MRKGLARKGYHGSIDAKVNVGLTKVTEKLNPNAYMLEANHGCQGYGY